MGFKLLCSGFETCSTPSTQHPRCLGAKHISNPDCWHHFEKCHNVRFTGRVLSCTRRACAFACACAWSCVVVYPACVCVCVCCRVPGVRVRLRVRVRVRVRSCSRVFIYLRDRGAYAFVWQTDHAHSVAVHVCVSTASVHATKMRRADPPTQPPPLP